MKRRLLTVRECAEFLGISKDLLYRMSSEKKIPHVRIGGRLLFDLRKLDRFIELNSIEAVDDWTEQVLSKKQGKQE